MIALNNGDVLALDLTGTATISVHIPYATTTGITLVPAGYTASLSADGTLITASGTLLLRNIYLLASADCNIKLIINSVAIVSANLLANKQWAFEGSEQLPGASFGGGHIVQDEGIDLPQRSKLNIIGAGAIAADDLANDATTITIAGAGGAGGAGLPNQSGNAGKYLSTDGTAASWQAIASNANRELINADRIYYVRTDGNDFNTGLINTPSGAFLTVQKAIDIACSMDFSVFNITIQLSDGTHAGNNLIKSHVGSGKLIIKGNDTNISSAIVSASSANTSCFYTLGQMIGTVYLEKLKLIASNANSFCIDQNQGNGYISFKNIDFGSSTGDLRVGAGAIIASIGDYTISGNCSNSHCSAYDGGFIRLGDDSNCTITIQNTPDLGIFCVADRGGKILAVNQTYSGATTSGTKHQASSTGLISKAGGNSFPGSASGTPADNAAESIIHSAKYGQYIEL